MARIGHKGRVKLVVGHELRDTVEIEGVRSVCVLTERDREGVVRHGVLVGFDGYMGSVEWRFVCFYEDAETALDCKDRIDEAIHADVAELGIVLEKGI